VIVIPLNSAKKLHNVVTVSKTGGDFTDPVAALNSITDASADNLYLVVIGPGVYTMTEPLITKSFVSIAGAGQEVTRLTGTLNGSIVSGDACDYTLSDLTIENTGGNQWSTGLSNSCYLGLNSPSPKFEDVTIIVSGGTTTNSGIRNYGVAERPGAMIDASPIMKNVTIRASGGTDSYGVYNFNASPTMINVTSSATQATNNYSIYNYYSYGKTHLSNCILKGDLVTLGEIWIKDSSITGDVTIDVKNISVIKSSISGDIKGGYAGIYIYKSSVNSITASGSKNCVFSDNFTNELDNDCVEITP